MQIFIKFFTGKVITLDVKKNETILEIKKRICFKEQIKASDFWLMYSATNLEDKKALDDYGITHESNVYAIQNYIKEEIKKKSTDNEFNIFVKCWLPFSIQIAVSPKMKVSKVKTLLSDKIGMSHSEIVLYVGCKTLIDNKTLEQSDITQDSIINMSIPSPGGGMPAEEEESKGPSLEEIKRGSDGHFAKDGPDYRNISLGLSIMGFCKNSKCITVKKKDSYVAKTIGFGNWAMNKIYGFLSSCPMCEEIFESDVFIFNKCFYTIYGQKKGKEDKLISFNMGIKEAPKQGYFEISIKPLDENSDDLEKALYEKDHKWKFLTFCVEKTEEEIENDPEYKIFSKKFAPK